MSDLIERLRGKHIFTQGLAADEAANRLELFENELGHLIDLEADDAIGNTYLRGYIKTTLKALLFAGDTDHDEKGLGK